MGDFQKLRVWQLAKEMAVDVYKLLRENPEFRKDFRFASQITSSAVSISSNIAEGDELKTNKQGIQHFYFAKGSNAEFMTQVIIAKEIGYIDEDAASDLLEKSSMISVALYKMIEARKKWS